jgi:hypothetical protein
MKNQMQRIFLTGLLISSFSACSIFESGGEAVGTVGRASGDALSGTGRAVGDAGRAVGDAGMAVGRGAGDIVEGTGDALSSGARRVERRGY